MNLWPAVLFEEFESEDEFFGFGSGPLPQHNTVSDEIRQDMASVSETLSTDDVSQ